MLVCTVNGRFGKKEIILSHLAVPYLICRYQKLMRSLKEMPLNTNNYL